MNIIAWIVNLLRLNPALNTKKKPRTLTSPGFGFTVEVVGDDLIVRDTRCTCFGGSNDPQDSGETASGKSTKHDPLLRGCALPMNYTGSHRPTREALFGSPLPRMSWGTLVEVTCEGKTIIVPVIDLGPAKRTGNGIDLTIAAAREFDPQATATRFAKRVTYRIPGGALHLSEPL